MSASARDGRDIARLRLRIERDARLQPMVARGRDRRADVAHRLVVERDAVAARRRERREVLRGVLDHQVHVDDAAPAVNALRDRLQDDRAHRDRLDEVTVADVEVKDAYACAEQRVDLLAESREIARVERRLDLGPAHPVGPSHRARS